VKFQSEAIVITLGALLQSPEEPQSAAAVPSPFISSDEDAAQLLELRTETGPIYVRPSRWQRMRLRWAFRNFHVLPPQVLSRRDQRLIEKLRRSAVVTPALPVASKSVFGVIEKVRSKSPASTDQVFTLKTELSATPAFLAQAGSLSGPAKSAGVKQKETPKAPAIPRAPEVPFEQWGAVGALAATCLTVILLSIYGVPLLSRTRQMSRSQTPATPVQLAANDSKPLHPSATVPLTISPVTASLPKAGKPKRWPATPPASSLALQEPPAAVSNQSTKAESASTSAAPVPDVAADTAAESAPIPAISEPRFVAELPPGYFAHPVVSQRDLVGELQLKALIAADGSVEKVTVVSGDPKLAEAGMRAVRQWRYRPYQVLGNPVEVETEIKMNFFGQDAISIGSVANAPTSQLK
jgi:protein TonB